MPTDVPLNLLDHVRIASPCTARWEDMTGTERVRYCDQCNLKVHNLSAMSRDEAEALVASHFSPGGTNLGQRLCGQWRKRADGTIILGDCPVGVAKLRRRVARSLTKIAAAVGLSSLAACSNQQLGGRIAPTQDGGGDDGEVVMMGSVAPEFTAIEVEPNRVEPNQDRPSPPPANADHPN